MAVIDEIQRQQTYHSQMGRGSLAIDESFDLGSFDLTYHFERAGDGAAEPVIAKISEILKEWAAAFKAGSQTLEYTAEEKTMLGRYNAEFREAYLGKAFTDEFKDQIEVQKLFDASKENTISSYGIRCLLISLFVKDLKIVDGDFPSAGHKYAYMAAIRTGLYEVFDGELIPSLWCVHAAR